MQVIGRETLFAHAVCNFRMYLQALGIEQEIRKEYLDVLQLLAILLESGMAALRLLIITCLGKWRLRRRSRGQSANRKNGRSSDDDDEFLLVRIHNTSKSRQVKANST